jgi:hypothetical protein
MPDTPRCTRCRTQGPEAFDSPTAAYCRECWAYITDHGRRFGEWAGGQIDRARGRGRGPFVA